MAAAERSNAHKALNPMLDTGQEFNKPINGFSVVIIRGEKDAGPFAGNELAFIQPAPQEGDDRAEAQKERGCL